MRSGRCSCALGKHGWAAAREREREGEVKRGEGECVQTNLSARASPERVALALARELDSARPWMAWATALSMAWTPLGCLSSLPHSWRTGGLLNRHAATALLPAGEAKPPNPPPPPPPLPPSPPRLPPKKLPHWACAPAANSMATRANDWHCFEEFMLWKSNGLQHRAIVQGWKV